MKSATCSFVSPAGRDSVEGSRLQPGTRSRTASFYDTAQRIQSLKKRIWLLISMEPFLQSKCLFCLVRQARQVTLVLQMMETSLIAKIKAVAKYYLKGDKAVIDESLALTQYLMTINDTFSCWCFCRTNKMPLFTIPQSENYL